MKYNFNIPLPNNWTQIEKNGECEDPNQWANDPQGAYKELVLLRKLEHAKDAGTLDTLGQQLYSVLQGTQISSQPLPTRAPDTPTGARRVEKEDPVLPAPVLHSDKWDGVDLISELYNLIVRARNYDSKIQVQSRETLAQAYEGKVSQLHQDIASWRAFVVAADARNKAQTENGDPNPPGGTPLHAENVKPNQKQGRKPKILTPDGRPPQSLKKPERFQLHRDTYAALSPEQKVRYAELAHPIILTFTQAGSPEKTRVQLGDETDKSVFKTTWVRDDFAILTPLLAGEEPDEGLMAERALPSVDWGKVYFKGQPTVQIGQDPTATTTETTEPVPTGTDCSVCYESQFETDNGISCKNGHAGAAPAEHSPTPAKAPAATHEPVAEPTAATPEPTSATATTRNEGAEVLASLWDGEEFDPVAARENKAPVPSIDQVEAEMAAAAQQMEERKVVRDAPFEIVPSANNAIYVLDIVTRQFHALDRDQARQVLGQLTSALMAIEQTPR